jgi:hypothetical protein
MALKIEPNQSAIAYHVATGATLFPYAIDAQHAISNHPLEWSDSPWRADDAAAARDQLNKRYEEDVADAKARNLPLPAPPPPEPAPLSPEEQAAVDEHNKAVAEAAERLRVFREKQAEAKAEADQVARDEALVASLPPAPDPSVRRPFGRKGEPTQAELDMIARRDAKKADDDRIAAEKAAADAQSDPNATITG